MDKAIETKLDTGLKTVKCTSLLHNIIIDFVNAVCIPDELSVTPYHLRRHERPGSSGQTELVAATSQCVRFARSFATCCDAGQPHFYRVSQEECARLRESVS